jgi:hypothetical protein
MQDLSEALTVRIVVEIEIQYFSKYMRQIPWRKDAVKLPAQLRMATQFASQQNPKSLGVLDQHPGWACVDALAAGEAAPTVKLG